MTDKEFLRVYLAAVKQAFSNDDVNLGFYVKPPIDYLEEPEYSLIDKFINENYEKYKILFDPVEYYFDAKSHNFTEIQGISINEYKNQINRIIEMYEAELET